MTYEKYVHTNAMVDMQLLTGMNCIWMGRTIHDNPTHTDGTLRKQNFLGAGNRNRNESGLN